MTRAMRGSVCLQAEGPGMADAEGFAGLGRPSHPKQNWLGRSFPGLAQIMADLASQDWAWWA